MSNSDDLLYGTYGHFTESALVAVRAATFGEDIGQNSWTTTDEYARFAAALELGAGHHVLEVACGSGGPALHLARTTGCRVTGLDASASAIATAEQLAAASDLAERLRFMVADATAPLPFEDGAFDAVLCVDAVNHLPNRLEVLREWNRVLRPGRRALFTDPVVVTGPVTSDELALRSSIGVFLFAPPGVNERFIEQAGLRLVHREDVTDNAAAVSGRWRDARAAHREALLPLEGEERFAGLQRFFGTVHRLASERRLSRYLYVAERTTA